MCISLYSQLITICHINLSRLRSIQRLKFKGEEKIKYHIPYVNWWQLAGIELGESGEETKGAMAPIAFQKSP